MSTKEIMSEIKEGVRGSQKIESFVKEVITKDLNMAANTLGQAQTAVNALNTHLTDTSKAGNIPPKDLELVIHALGVLVPQVPGLAGALVQSQDKIGSVSGIKDLKSSISALETENIKEKSILDKDKNQNTQKSIISGKDVESSIRSHKELNSMISNFKVSVEKLGNNGVTTDTLLDIGISAEEVGSGRVGLLPLAVEAIKTSGKISIEILSKSGVPPPIIEAIKSFKHSLSLLSSKDKYLSDFMIFDAIDNEINTVDK